MDRPPTPPLPHPDLDPERVVALVLEALSNHDHPHPDAGIDTLYAFASPRMRHQIGDRSALGRALHNSRYAALLGHAEAVCEPLERLGDGARQQVWITTEGEQACYLFALVRNSHGEATGCWLLNGLRREGAD